MNSATVSNLCRLLSVVAVTLSHCCSCCLSTIMQPQVQVNNKKMTQPQQQQQQQQQQQTD